MKLKKILQQYYYSLPKEFIAQIPARPRDSARLFVYDRSTKKTFYDSFLHLPKYLPPRAVLVFNETKVLPARLTLKKPTGGKVIITYITHDRHGVTVLSDRKITIGSTLTLTQSIKFLVTDQRDQFFILKPTVSSAHIEHVFQRYGSMPLPPYLRHSPLSEKDRRNYYQTLFAKQSGSVAAPTASLHFTKRLMKKLERADMSLQFITLHVNLGTFAPLTDEHMRLQKLHTEHFCIDRHTAAFLNTAKQQGRPIIAVGTTVVRALESATNARGELSTRNRSTDIFIHEPYHFKFVNGMITNFHVPCSSLLMLVAALIGRKKLFALYEQAKKKRFRFFSFGDGMLIR